MKLTKNLILFLMMMVLSGVSASSVAACPPKTFADMIEPTRFKDPLIPRSLVVTTMPVTNFEVTTAEAPEGFSRIQYFFSSEAKAKAVWIKTFGSIEANGGFDFNTAKRMAFTRLFKTGDLLKGFAPSDCTECLPVEVSFQWTTNCPKPPDGPMPEYCCLECSFE